MNPPLVFTGGMAATNAYLLDCPNGRVLVDAPEGTAGWLRSLAVKPGLIFLTHQHYDHVQDAAAVAAWAGCPIAAHSQLEPELTLLPMLRAAGYPVEVPDFTVTEILAGQETIDFAGCEARLAYVPGHARDSLAAWLPEHSMVFSGDTLFEGGVGRTDLPGGSWALLEAGIRRHLLSLPDDTQVFPGHGGPTTIGAEKHGNPFLSV